MNGPGGWIATDDYRWYQRAPLYFKMETGSHGLSSGRETVLQRRWISSDGVIKWEDVETVRETNEEAEARLAAMNARRAKA